MDQCMIMVICTRRLRCDSVFVTGAEGVHEGVTPAVDRFQCVVGSCADGCRVGLEKGGFAERVTMAGGQVDDIVETGGGLQFLVQPLIVDGAVDKGLEGGVIDKVRSYLL